MLNEQKAKMTYLLVNLYLDYFRNFQNFVKGAIMKQKYCIQMFV
jgi:hypothetical protein